MKKMSFKRQATIAINALLYAVLWSAIVYGCIAFIIWDCNPKNWSWDARYMMTFFGFVAGCVVGVLGANIIQQGDE